MDRGAICMNYRYIMLTVYSLIITSHERTCTIHGAKLEKKVLLLHDKV